MAHRVTVRRLSPQANAGPRHVSGAPPLISPGALAAQWGLHPLDAKLALGNIVSLISSETKAFGARARAAQADAAPGVVQAGEGVSR